MTIELIFENFIRGHAADGEGEDDAGGAALRVGIAV